MFFQVIQGRLLPDVFGHQIQPVEQVMPAAVATQLTRASDSPVSHVAIAGITAASRVHPSPPHG